MERRRPLEGIRVLDFAWVQAGPWIGRFLASYGAQVIRIESAVRPDYARLYPLGLVNKDGTHMDLLFNNVNCDKLGITLNLSASKGIEIAKKLISISDVVIDNFRSGQMEKFGLEGQIEGISRIHGKLFKSNNLFQGITIIPFYHPAVATYNSNMKKVLEEDFKILKTI